MGSAVVSRGQCELCELFYDILYHSNIDIAFHIVPFQGNATVEVAIQIFDNFICFLP